MMQFHETLPAELRWQVSQQINEVCPAHWERIRLNEIARVQNGFAFESKFFSKNGSGYPLIRIRDVGAPDTETNYSGEFDREYIVRHGDILIGMDGQFRCRKWLGRDALLNQRVCRLVPTSNDVHFEFFFKILQPYLDAVEQVTSSITVKHLSSRTVEELELPLPPLAEQRRIVAKIEALQERCRRAREILSEVEPLLEQFRQSVLAAAFRGDLTADWRAAHPNIEPASELLGRIRAERRRRWEQAELAQYKAKGQKSPKNWQDRYQELELVDDSELPELPNGWVWTTWESILSLDDGSFKRGPFGSALKKSIFVSSGYKVYEQYCPINDDCSYVRYYITPEKYDELKAFAVKARDFLISCSGVTLGRITQVPDDFEEGIINQALLRVRINNEIVNDQFFLTLFRSPYFQKQIFDNATGSAIPNVKGVKDLKAIPVPVPPLAEQLEVLERLKERLDYIRGIEDDVKELSAAFDHLDQAILAKAFRGELVPQDPSDEPASVLLERIRAKRGQQAEATEESFKMRRRDKMEKKSAGLTSQQRPLAEILAAKGQPMPPEQLLTEAGYDDAIIEDFYVELREEVRKGRIREGRLSEGHIMLEASER